MKTQILKISGHKNLKDFYKEFPTQESFMAKHGASLKKAQAGADMNSNGVPDYLEYSQPNEYTGTGNINRQFGSAQGNPNFGPQNQPYQGIQLPKYQLPQGKDIFNPSSVIQPYQGNPNIAQQNQQITGDIMGGAAKGSTPTNQGPTFESGIGVIDKTVGAFKALKGERDALKSAKQWKTVSDVALKASNSRDVNARGDIMDTEARKRKALMPTITGEELFPVTGVGTNVLTKNGGKISKAQMGGMMSNFFGGAGQGAPWQSIGNSTQAITNSAFGNNAGTQFGGAAADVVGMIPGVGPIASALAKPVFSAIGGMLDKNPQKTKKFQNQMMNNVSRMSGMNAIQGYQNNYTGVFEDGGNMRSNNVGGIEAVSGGYLEPMSYNPYTQGTGITSMIKGQSHDESNGRHSGVILDYAGNRVEAERGEPISERQDGGPMGETTAIIAGDQTLGKEAAMMIPSLTEYSNKKVKNIQKEIAMDDAKLNKLQTKNTITLNTFKPTTPIDKLKFNSLTMTEKGVNDKYAINAKKTNDLLDYQEAINNVAHERGLDAGALSRGKYKAIDERAAKNGMQMFAQNGKTVKASRPGAWDYIPAGQTGNTEFDTDYGGWTSSIKQALSDPERTDKMLNYIENISGPGSEQIKTAVGKRKTKAEKIAFLEEQGTNRQVGPMHHILQAARDTTAPRATKMPITQTAPATVADKNYEITPYQKSGWETLAGQIMPWMRKTPGEPLLGDQLAGEMYAMSNNQVDPVQARFYHPDLNVPYDVSFQDRLNANQGDFNAIQKTLGNNPEALAAMAAQKYGANSGVLAEQFRANQAMKDQVYSGNRATLNDAQMKNLGIADQQYVRQAQAKSNTKAAMQEALNSVSSKIGQNRLENRTLQTYANMFPQYSYDKNYSIHNTGAPVAWNIPQQYNPDTTPITHVPMYDKNGNVVGMQQIDQTQPATKETGTRQPSLAINASSRNGSIIRAFRNI